MVTFADLVHESDSDIEESDVSDGESVLHGSESESTQVYSDWAVQSDWEEQGPMSASTGCGSGEDSDFCDV